MIISSKKRDITDWILMRGFWKTALWWKVAGARASWANQPFAKCTAIVLEEKADLTFYHLSSVTSSLSNDAKQKWNKLWRCAPVIDHYTCGHDCRINLAHREVPDTWSKMKRRGRRRHCRRMEFASLSKVFAAVGGTKSFQFRRRAKQLCRLATSNWMANKRLGSSVAWCVTLT